MEQTRKLLADAFDKDPIKQQYCIFYVDHLLASGRISTEPMITHTVGLNELPRAFAALTKPSNQTKVMIEL